MTTGTEKNCGISDRDRLSALADSVNDTARMARINVSLMLLVALYIAIMILLAADDNNVFRDEAITLPYFVVGISLKQSYLVAPVVLIWLHLQTLLLLAVLARKLDSFETVLANVPSTINGTHAERRNWLSGTIFVQSVHGAGGIALFAKVMMWMGVVIIPPLLLFLADMSFLKYQSAWITGFHHIVFCVDLLSVGIFSLHISGRLRECRWSRTFGLLNPVEWLEYARGPRGIAEKIRTETVVVMLTIVTLLAFIAALWAIAPPIAYGDKDDTMLCWKQWRIFCRNLDLEGAILTGSADPRDLVGFEELDAGTIDRYRRFYTLDAKDRSFRFVNLKNSYVSGVRLDGADLRGADLEGASLFVVGLQGSDLRDANLKRSDLSSADLTDTFLHEADLESATFSNVRLRRANFEKADLKGTNLSGTNLEGAILWARTFEGANFSSAHLRGASFPHNAGLEGANLSGADLTEADMSGVNLKDALLLGVRLSETMPLRGDLPETPHEAHLSRANLYGADLRRAIIAGWEGQPTLDGHTRLEGVVSNPNNLQARSCSKDDIRCYLESLGIEPDLALAWKPDVTLIQHLHDTSSRDHVVPGWLDPTSRARFRSKR